MPGLNITVSLSEVLEVRGSPLKEAEIWALLCLGTEALQDSFISEQATNEFGPVFVINPDTFSLTQGGQVEFGHAQRVQQYANYMAPETEEDFALTASAVEQIYVYALGKSLVYSAEFGLRPEEPLRISHGLESVLGSMTNRNPAERIAMVKVLEACSLQTARHKIEKQSLSHIALDLYRTVLGVEGQEDSMQDNASLSDKSRPITSKQEVDPDRSRRKKRRSRNSGKHKKRSPVQRYRSRSNSRSSGDSRSRSRSHSRNGRGRGRRGADSPDSGYHRHTPSHDENYSRTSRPDLHSAAYSTGRSYHLSDITFSASQNGQNSKRKSSNRRPDSRQARNGTKPQSGTNTKGTMKDNDIRENPAFKKYLKLKERQRKLRGLRGGVVESTESDELSDIVMDHMSETRSVMSLVSHSQGAYRPDIHKQYGSNSALKMGQESDLDSILSSDTSMLAHDNVALRANGDISDPYIQQLQQMTAAPPPPPVFAAKPPVAKQKQQKNPVPRQPPPQKHKEFYGPEFIHRSTRPISRIALPLQGESRKNPSHVCRVVVVLLNGQKMEVMCDPSTTGQNLFEAVVTHIELPEFYFFGLTYVNDDEHFFIPADTKLHKVAADGWKDSWKMQAAPITFTVYLRVKFYVESLPALKHETTRHQHYLQLRRDLLEERCHCDETKALALAGLALQAEYGDYNQETMGRNYFVPEHYFPGRVVKRLGSGYVRDHAPEAHMDFKGLSETEAELEFIKLIQEELPEYGIHFHKLLKKKGDTSNIIWIGLNINEMILAENSGGQRIIVQHHPWGAIQKISFNRRRFSVQPRPDIGQAKPIKMNFFTTTYRKGQYLLKFCTAQHSFQLKMKSRLALNGEADNDSITPDHESIGTTEDIDSGNTDDEGTITDEHISPREADVEMEAAGFAARDDIPQKQPVAYRNPPPYRPNSCASLIDLPGPKIKNSKPAPRAASSDDVRHNGVVQPTEDEHLTDVEEMIKPSQVSDTNQAYVIDMSTRSTDETLFPPSGNETISNTLHQRFKDELLSPEPATTEREVFEVVLIKDPEFGIGMTIVGGDGKRDRDLGIFVKSVAVNGPAQHDGRIKPGDKILAINDSSVEGLPHHEAVKLIKYSSSQVKLKISQIRPPGSLRKHDHDDKSFRMKLRGSFMDESKKENLPNEKEISPSLDAAGSSPMPVITVEDCASVHNDDKTEENDKKIDDKMTSIPDGVNVCENHGRNSADVHSTLSQVDSLNSEMAVPELPVDEQNNIVEIHEESDIDSDFDDRIDAIVNEAPIIDEHILAETAEKVMASTRKSTSSSSETPTETFEVFLEKKRGSFGLNVTGGVNTSVRYGGIYVKSIVPDGAADEEGTIRKGDRILMVDDKKLDGFTHKQAVQTLCEAPPFCRLVIERGVIPPSRHSSTSSHHSQRSDNRTTVEKLPRKAVPPQVQRLKDGSPLVAESPTAQVKVLEMSLTSTTADDINDEAGTDDRVTVDEMQIDQGLSQDTRELLINVNQLYEKIITKDNCYKVILKKSSQGLGFSIVGSETPVEDETLQFVTRIKRVFPIGPAADSKKIAASDVILSVNGQDMRKLTNTETMMALRTAGKIVTLILCRPDPEKLPPLPVLENQESLEVTPASSGSNLTDTDTSDSDSDDVDDGGITPAREVLITPPTGFSPQKYPVDENGSILPKIISPPPPLPQSPPPALIRSGSVTPPSVTVELGVAELMDSCRSEMVKIHHTREDKLDERDTTPIVREYSTLGFEPSRESTPSVSSEKTTPVHVVECSTLDSEDFNNVRQNLGSLVNISETGDSSVGTVQESPNKKVIQSVLQRAAACDESDTESESTLSAATDKSTSLTDSRLGTFSQQDGLQSLGETDNQDTSLAHTFTVETEPNSLTDLNVCNDSKSVEECDIEDDIIDVNEAKLDVHNDDIDTNLRLLEQKYSEMEKEEEENDAESESEESTSTDDDEQSSVRETFSQMLEESLHPGEIEVTLTKPEGKGLGFTVAGGANTTGGCYVKAVLQNPALSDGRLKAGDRLIRVNGIDMRSLNHFEAVTVLREAANQVVIRIYREPQEDPELGDTYIHEIDDQSLSEKGPEGLEKGKDIDDGTLETESLDEQASESESDESSQDREPALSEDGRLVHGRKAICQTEDRQPVQDKDSEEEEDETEDSSPIQDLIESLEKSLIQTSVQDRGDFGKNQSDDGLSQKEAIQSSPKSPHSPEVSVCHIDLEKPPSGGLGISLVTGESENQTGVFIRTISPGGVAHDDGRLSVGDKILQINGKSLIGLNHSKAATLLRNSEGRVILTVSRNRDKKPVWVDGDKEADNAEANSKQLDIDTGHSHKLENSDSDSEHSEVEDESSLSLTKHLPGDIDDDNVEDLVREAEKTLEDAENELNNDNVDREVLNDGMVHEDKSHRYLRAAETIEYHHDEIDIEADEQTDLLEEEEDSSKVNEEDSENSSDREQEDYEDDFLDYDEDDNDGKINTTADAESDINQSDQRNFDDQNIDDSTRDDENNDDDNNEDVSAKCWCDSLRKLDAQVPDEVTPKWLYSLSVATIPEEVKSSIPGLIAELQEKIEVDDPQEEFKQLRTVKPTDECSAAYLVYNREKNRFRNVLPYDLNRVRLSDDSETDYINASYVQIDVSDIICDYIACQGPLPNTTDDFWEMIWQQDVTVIVMLTLDMEAMKVKCHRYWPDSVDTPIEVCDGRYRLSLLYQNVLDNFDIRNILIENLETEESRSIYHLNYTTWPDHGVPESAVPLLQCMRLSHQLRASGPLVVHCSAGIGRTGTFITIDVALAHVEKSLKCEILDIVSELRRQRQGMIQTRDQYLFCYTAIIEALLSNTN